MEQRNRMIKLAMDNGAKRGEIAKEIGLDVATISRIKQKVMTEI